MSVKIETKPVSVRTFLNRKSENKKITVLTAYDCSTARYIDEAGVDCLLVGDSVGMTVLGYENTLQVTVEDMETFTRAVSRGAKHSLVVSDMPFLSYQVSKEKAIENAGRLIRAGAQAVKLEGAGELTLDIIKSLVEAGIAVVGHLGFTPQSINSIGGYYVQGKSYEQAVKLLEDAKKVQEAGAFSLVLEMVPEEVAKIVTEKLSIPTIGIGAGRYCDGQVLVIDDIIGKYGEFTPKFARKYADVKEIIFNSAKKYDEEVKSGVFPSEEHTFKMEKSEIEKFENYLKQIKGEK
ncbi:3-methyl-2-oxobutanoate hydroxymethyltransferase [bacterium]|nr:3-methyl-2-oxobutanoate hydroxymethyltransferase [bacterium]